jgi:phosphotransferase system  glucose/maltose/N-acetylglucosamine-specific IIC component
MKTIFSLTFLVLALSSVSAFMPTLPSQQQSTRHLVQMNAESKTNKVGAGIVGTLTPMIMAAPVLATEGTGEAFGVDDSRIPFVVLAIGAAFTFLFSTWSNSQDNDEFFDGYNKKRN